MSNRNPVLIAEGAVRKDGPFVHMQTFRIQFGIHSIQESGAGRANTRFFPAVGIGHLLQPPHSITFSQPTFESTRYRITAITAATARQPNPTANSSRIIFPIPNSMP